MNLSEIDKKILFELDKDGRASFSEIARVLNSTPQVIKYHVEQLQEKGTLKNFWAFIDYDKADYSFFWGYLLKFSGLSKEKEIEIYKEFDSNMYVPIVQRLDGYADALIGIIAKDIFHHNQVLQDIHSAFGQYITSSDIFIGLGFMKFPRTYLIDKENEFQKLAISGGTTEKIKLTETDRKILSLLQIDGRMEFTKIAKILNVSIGLIHKHYHKLEKSGVITKITFTTIKKLDFYYIATVSRSYSSMKNVWKICTNFVACIPTSSITSRAWEIGNYFWILKLKIANNFAKSCAKSKINFPTSSNKLKSMRCTRWTSSPKWR